MKRCSYCGAEYPDDATVCTTDQTPLEGMQLESIHTEPPTFSITTNWNKILSTSVCIIYSILALIYGGILPLVQTVCICFVLLQVIWYADDIGSYTDRNSGGYITSPTPGWLVGIFGWIFLLAPGVFAIYSIATRKH